MKKELKREDKEFEELEGEPEKWSEKLYEQELEEEKWLEKLGERLEK